MVGETQTAVSEVAANDPETGESRLLSIDPGLGEFPYRSQTPWLKMIRGPKGPCLEMTQDWENSHPCLEMMQDQKGPCLEMEDKAFLVSPGSTYKLMHFRKHLSLPKSQISWPVQNQSSHSQTHKTKWQRQRDKRQKTKSALSLVDANKPQDFHHPGGISGVPRQCTKCCTQIMTHREAETVISKV